MTQLTRPSIEAKLLEQLRAASAPNMPIIAVGYELGGFGVRADIAILGDELLGILVKGATDTLDGLDAKCRLFSRYFDRTLLLIAPDHLDAFDMAMIAGTAIWTVAADGTFIEIAAGDVNMIGLSAYFELLPTNEKRRLLEPLRAYASMWARGESPISTTQARQHFEAAFTARYGRASENFWATVNGRSVSSDDLAKLHVCVGTDTVDRVLAA